MNSSRAVSNEKQRLQLLTELDLLDTPPDPGLDAIVAAASSVCGTPISLVSLVAEDRQWSKAAIGMEQGSESPREHAFCGHAIRQNSALEITDTTQDPRFAGSPLVTDDPHVRFYAGMPIRVAGEPLGTLCVMDREPRTLTDGQRAVLESLAVAASELIATRYRDLAEQRLQLASVIQATEVAVWEYHVPSGEVQINDRWAGLIGYTRAELEPVSVDKFESLIHPDDAIGMRAALDEHLAGDADSYECEMRMRHKDGHWVWVMTRGRVLEWEHGDLPRRMFGVHLDIQRRKERDESLRRMHELLEDTGQLARVGGWQLDVRSQELIWTSETKRIHGVPDDFQPNVDSAIDFYAPEARDTIRDAVATASSTGKSWDLELPLVRADGERIWVHARGSAILEDGEPIFLYGAFQDISERRQMLMQISESRERLRVTLESIGDAVITTDGRGHVTWLNPCAEELTGWSLDEAMDVRIGDIVNTVNEHSGHPVREPVSRCLAERRVVAHGSDGVLISRDGHEYGIEGSAAPILADDGDLVGAVMVLRDVSEQRRLTGEIRYRAKHDVLTGLINRSEFELRLQQLLEDVQDDETEHAVMFIDLDQFKIVNDSCGHAVGDELLQELAHLFQDTVRQEDTVARLGGDEFAVILERCPQDRALERAERVLERVRAFRFVHGDQRFRIGVSIGLVQMSREWPNISGVLQAADTACYAAKRAGRDRVHLYESSDVAIQNQRSETLWATQLEDALDNDRFVLFCQPIVPADPVRRPDTRPSLELLVRMQREDGELIYPGAFIPAAERFHLITRIDRWVVEQTLRALLLPSLIDTTLFINLSGRSVGDRLFQEFALGVLRDYDSQARQRLVFEITETAVISNLIEVRQFLEELRGLGVGVALDDFGSGMASFGYLNALPVSFLKLDGEFVNTMQTDALAMAAVRSFIDVAGVLGVPTIAEHVENASIAESLLRMGVDLVQGYHIGRPEPLQRD